MAKKRTHAGLPQDSPVEAARKALPRGKGDWPGYSKVYSRLQAAADYLARCEHTRLGDDHLSIMAASGSGDEETMKYYAMLALTYGWCK